MDEKTLKAEVEYLKLIIQRLERDCGRMAEVIRDKDNEIERLRKKLYCTKVELFETKSK